MEEIKTKIQHNLDHAKKLRHEGQSSEAISLLIDTLTLCRELNYGKGEVQTLGNLGLVYKNLGRFEEAIGYLREAVGRARTLSLWHELEVSLTNLGSALSELGRPSKALPIYDEARALCVRHNDLKGLAMCEVFLGNTYLRLGNPEIAENHYTKAEEIYQQVNDPLNQAHLNVNLGALAHRRGDFEATANYMRRALISYRNVNYVRGILTALNNLGGTLMDLGQLDEAKDFLEEALQLAKEGGIADFAWRIAGNMAEWYRRQNNPVGALSGYEDAIALLDDLRIQLTMPSSRLDFFEQRLSRYADLIYFAIYEAKQPIFALEYVERARGRVFVEELAVSVEIKSQELSNDWLERERFLLDQLKEGQDVDLTIEVLDKLRTTQRQLEAHWYKALAKAPEYISLRLGKPLSWHEMQEVLLV